MVDPLVLVTKKLWRREKKNRGGETGRNKEGHMDWFPWAIHSTFETHFCQVKNGNDDVWSTDLLQNG